MASSGNFKRLVRTQLTAHDDKLVVPRLDQWLHTHSHLLLDGKRADILKDIVTTPPRDRSKSFSSSSRGKCQRLQMFGYIGVPAVVEVDAQLNGIFIDGTWRHLRWQMMLLMAGIITDVEYSFDVPSLRLKGSLDGVNIPERWGFELKGTSQHDIVSGMQPPIPYHLMQIHTYFIGVPQLKKFSLVYEDKKFQGVREEVIVRDPAIMDEVEAELNYLNECVDDRTLPPVLKECTNGKSDTFKRCPYRRVCLGCQDYGEAEALAKPVRIQPRKRRRRVELEPAQRIVTPTVQRVREQHRDGEEEAPGGRRKRRKVHPA